MYVYDNFKLIKVNVVGNFHKHRHIQLKITVAVKGEWQKSRSVSLSPLFSISSLHSASAVCIQYNQDTRYKIVICLGISFKIDNDSNTYGVKNIPNDTVLLADQEKNYNYRMQFLFWSD